MFQTFPHTADLGIRIRASSLDALYEDAALGLFSVLVANLDEVIPTVTKQYRIEGERLDFLLFDWLNELLFTFESENLLLSKFDVHVDGFNLDATARGEPVDPKRHRLDHEVKAITYHELKVDSTENGYTAELIVDI